MKIQAQIALMFSCGTLLLQIVACADVRSNKSAVPTAHAGTGCSIAVDRRATQNGANYSVPCRSFSGEEIRNTGATSFGAALRQLDPSISINH
jgi:hypothetical protein